MIEVLSNIGWPAVAWAALFTALVILAPLAVVLASHRRARREERERAALWRIYQEKAAHQEQVRQAENNRTFYEGLPLEGRR